MGRRAGDVARADGQQMLRLRAMAADMVVELQRADAKATAVCGAAAGLLTAGVATLCGVNAPSGLEVALLSTSLLLTAAVGAALWALRPVLPRPVRLTNCSGCGGERTPGCWWRRLPR